MKLVCRDCQAAQARRGLLLHQRRFLQTYLAGKLSLRVREQQGKLHLELYDDRWHGYCGTPLFNVTPRRLVSELPPEICTECRATFDGLLAAAAKEG